TQIGSDIATTATSTPLDIAVHRQNWASARYALDACNSSGCTRSNEVPISSGMIAAIGYVKASNTEAFDQFGYSVAVSGDGSTLVVGALGEDSNATGINGMQADNSFRPSANTTAGFTGAVYVF